MPYEPLTKLYYRDRAQYRAEYDKRFSADNTVHVPIRIHQNEAFFCVPDEAVELLYAILKCSGEIGVLCAKLPPVALLQYQRRCLIDEVVVTNGIEGVHSSRKEIGEALAVMETQSEKRGKRTRFSGIVRRYRMLTETGARPVSTCSDVRELYDELVLPEVTEEHPDHAPDGVLFRKDPATVIGRNGKILHYGVYPESEILKTMDRALGFWNDASVNPLYRACVFHYLVGYIHPFYDGNGRLGRFLLSQRLSAELHPLIAYRISETIRENLSAYYKAFETANSPIGLGDLTPFLLTMLRFVKQAAEDLLASLREKTDRLHVCSTLAAEKLPSCDAETVRLLLQTALFGEGGVTAGELAEASGCSEYLVKSRLSRIEACGALTVRRNGKRKLYELNLGVLDEA